MRLNIRVPWPLDDRKGNDWPGTRLIPISKASLDRAFQPTALCKPHGECQVESLKKMMEHCKPHGECQVESPEEDEGAVAGASQGMWRFIDLTLTLFCQMYIFADHDLEPVGFDTAHLHPQFGQPVAG